MKHFNYYARLARRAQTNTIHSQVTLSLTSVFMNRKRATLNAELRSDVV